MIGAWLARTHRRLRGSLRAASLLGTDVFGRHQALWLVSTEPHREALLESLSSEDPLAFLPRIEVFSEWCAELWARFGDGRALMPETSGAHAAQQLLEDPASRRRWPMLASIADRSAVARELVALEVRSSLFGDKDPGTARSPEVDGAITALRQILDQDPRFIRKGAMLSGLVARFAAPSPAMQRELHAHRTLIVDDLPGVTPLESALLVAAARALSARDVSVIFATACGRDRGGAEVGLLLGWDAPRDRELRVFAASVHLRRALLALVETGEASIFLARGGLPVEFQPGSEPSHRSARDLADAYADGAPIEVDSPEQLRAALGPIRLVCAPDPSAEFRFVARSVERLLTERQIDPRDCVIALADRATAVDVMASLEDIGIPCRSSEGIAIGTLPIGILVSLVASAALDNFPPESICAIAAAARWSLCPELDTPSPETIPRGLGPQQVLQWCRAARVRGGRPRVWPIAPWASRTGAVSSSVHRPALARLDALASLLSPLSLDRTPRDWLSAMHDALSALGIDRIASEDEQTARAYAALSVALFDLARDLEASRPGIWRASALRDALDALLEGLSVDLSPRGVPSVTLIPLDDLMGPVPQHLFVCGLARGSITEGDRGSAPPTLLGEPIPELTSIARFRFASLLREALDSSADRTLVLSWPATRKGNPSPPAPVLAELIELPTSLGPALSALATEPLPVSDEPLGRRESLAAAARSPAWLSSLSPLDQQMVQAQRAAVLARQGALTSRDGILAQDFARPSALTVTSLETYNRCPARYWYTHILSVAPPDRSTVELEPKRRGIALHGILERFLLERDLAPLSGMPEEERPPARAALLRVANAVLDEIDAEGGVDPLFQRYARRRWVAGLVDNEPAGILRVWLDAEIDGPACFPEAVEERHDSLVVGPITLKGAIDRVDRFPSGARLVTDYKTGAPPQRGWIERGLSLQPVAYSAMVAQATGAPVAASFLSLGRPDEFGRTSFFGDPAALDEVCKPAERRRAVVIDAAKREELLERAAQSAMALLAGRFPPSSHPPEVAGCTTCPFRRICRVDPQRHGLSSDRDLEGEM